MRRIPVACRVAALALAGPAWAADVPAPAFKAPMQALPAPYDWSGFHVGGSVGYSLGRADTTLAIAGFPLAPIATTMNGPVGGVQVGHDWQMKAIVLGVESDIQATGQRGTSGIGPGTLCPTRTNAPAPCRTTAGSIDESLPWLATFRGRLGVTPMDRLLVYVTAGRTIAQVETSTAMTTTTAFPGGPALATASSATSGNPIRAGWTMGAGAEWALWDRWTAKLEYLRLDLGTAYKAFTGPGGLAAGTASNRVTDNIVRIGVNYRFGAPPPAVATR